MRSIEPSATLLLNEQSRHLEASGQKIYKFGFGQSPFLPPTFVREALAQNVHRKEYTAVQGLPVLREAVASFHQQLNQIATTADDVMIASGSKSLLFTLLAAFTEANVMIPAPAWVSYAPQARLLGHTTTRLETTFEDRWRITPSQIEHHISTKQPNILILNYPGNPDGLTYTQAEIERLADICQKHGVWVISDEIYALLTHTQAHFSFARVHPDRTFTTTGLSKWCGAGGWRLGVALLPPNLDPHLKQNLLGIASETYSCAPTPIQYAAIEAYNDVSRIEPYLEAQRNVLSQIGQFCASSLTEAGIQVHAPEGGFYLFPDFSPFRAALMQRGIETVTALCSTLLAETGVAVLPAHAFGFDESMLAARLAYVDFDDPLVQNQLAEPFDLGKHAPKMLEGIQSLCEWVKGL